MSLEKKLITILLLLVVTPVIVTLLVLESRQVAHIEETTGRQLENNVAREAEDINRYLEERLEDARSTGQNPAITRNAHQEVSETLAKLVETYPHNRAFYLADEQGITRASSDPTFIGKSIFEAYADVRELFDTALLGDIETILASDISHGTSDRPAVGAAEGISPDDLSIRILSRIRSQRNRPEVLLSVVNVNHIAKIVSNLDKSAPGDEFTYLLNHQGNVLISQDPRARFLQPHPDATVKELRAVLASDQNGFLIYPNRSGQRIVSGYADLKEFGSSRTGNWQLLASAPYDQVAKPITRKFTQAIVLTIIFLIATSLVMVGLIRRLTRPLRKLAITARQIQEGHFDARVDEGASGEAGVVALAFNQMMNAVQTEIRERHLAEATLREAEERFRLMIEGVKDYAIFMLDPGGHVATWNKGAETIKGYLSEEIIGKHFSSFYTDEDIRQGKPKRELQIAAKVGRYEEEGDRVRKDGTRFFAHVVITAIRDEVGSLLGFSKVTKDITEQKRNEVALKQARDEAKESTRLKSEFLANMSHEIRTPMNGVIGMTELMLDTDLTIEQREFTETIKQSSDALMKIINDILDFSKIEAGMLHFETIDFDLRTAVESTVELFAERAASKDVELASLVTSDVMLRGDPGRLRQVLTNLIGNALKFTEEGEVIVRASKDSETDSHVIIRFAVSDTGIGIPSAAQEKLFKAFVQADGSTTRNYGGTGLGLAISKQIVELMNGDIGLESEPGQGSTFWFTVALEKQLHESFVATLPRTNLDGMRLLIVDDNMSNRSILVNQAASWNMITAEAPNGKEALAKLREAAERNEPFEVALIDVQMPELDGFDLAQAIKADSLIASVRLILMPNGGLRDDGKRASNSAVVAYLNKPVRQSQYLNSLATVLDDSGVGAGSPLNSLRPVARNDPHKAEVTSSVRILLAEDNRVNQIVATRQLKTLGYTADVVGSGKAALDALEKTPYDIILMDCQMPEMDGFEATRQIRLREGGAHHTTIIAITANAMDGDRERCVAAGMDDYISKPVNMKDLQRALQDWQHTSSDSRRIPDRSPAPAF